MMTNPTPAVSVIVPTRNRPDWLARALKAIARQTLPDYEVLVIDDGSNAATLEQYAPIWAELDDRFLLRKAPYPDAPGVGPAAARNRGLQQARGEFVAFCDDDDYWRLPDHLGAAVRALRAHDADLYFANMRGERDGKVTIPDWFPDCRRLTAGPCLNPGPPVYDVGLSALMAVMRHHYPHLNTCVARRCLVQGVGGFWEPSRGPEDIDLVLRLADRARRILYRPECTAVLNTVPRSSIFNDMHAYDFWLMCGFVTRHVQAVCRRSEVRACARALESWALRQLSRVLRSEGRPLAALALAWQAFGVFPTFGGAADLVRTGLSSVGMRFRQVVPLLKSK